MISPMTCLMLLLKFCSMLVVSILVLTVNWTTIESPTPKNIKAGAKKETRKSDGSVLKGTNNEKGDIGEGGGVLSTDKRDIVEAGTKRNLETPHVIPLKLVRFNQGLKQDDLMSVRCGHLNSCKTSKEISVNTFYGKQKFNNTCTTAFSLKDRKRRLYSHGAVVGDSMAPSMKMGFLQNNNLDLPIPPTKAITKLDRKENKDFKIAENIDINLLVHRSFLLCSCDNFCSNTNKLNSQKKNSKIMLIKRSNQYVQIKTEKYAQKIENNGSSREAKLKVPNELASPKKEVEKTAGGFSVNKFYGNRKRFRATTLEFITETKALKYDDLEKPTDIDKRKTKDFAIPKINIILDQGNKDVYEAEIDEIKIQAIVQHSFLLCSCRNCDSTCLKLNSQLTHKKKQKKKYKSNKKRRSTKYWKDLFKNKFKN